MKVQMRNGKGYEDIGTIRLIDGKAQLQFVDPKDEALFNPVAGLGPDAGEEYLNMVIEYFGHSSTVALFAEQEDTWLQEE
jgi:hypothetical protein